MRKLFSLVIIVALHLLPLSANSQIITTIAGNGLGDGGLATNAEVVGPVGVCTDAAGNIYIAQQGAYTVRKIDVTGIITSVAGDGSYGNSGDGGPATNALIGVIYGLAMDKSGNLYMADNSNNCIRKVSASGIISTIAGTGTAGYTGDNGPATAAELNVPIEVVVDTAGNVIFTDWQNSVVRKINTAGIITTIVGDGSVGSTGNGGPATASELGAPFRIAMDKKGNLYVAEVIYQCICKVDTAGILTIIADAAGTYALGADGDGGPATAATMTSPCGLAVDTFGNLFFSDIGNNRIRKIDMNTGIISNYAATGVAGYGGDGGPATAAQISTPEALACNIAGDLFICDPDNNRLRKTDRAGMMSTVAGRSGLFDEGVSAVSAELCSPNNICTDASGNIYIADMNNQRVRMINSSTGLITTVAGSGETSNDFPFSGDGGPATDAHMYYPVAVAVDPAGNIYLTDQINQRIRKVNTSGIISTIAGNGTAGFRGNGTSAITAELQYPAGIAADTGGNVFVADNNNHIVRKISPAGIITTVAGIPGSAGYSGDSVQATDAQLNFPTDVALDGLGNIYITDGANYRVRKVDTAGVITTVAGTGTYGYSGDSGPATAAMISYCVGLKADNFGNIFVADEGNERIRQITPDGNITTIAGSGTSGFSGDGGLAVLAEVNGPAGVALDGAGNLFVSDDGNNRIRKVTLTLAVQSVNKPKPWNVQVYPNPTSGILTIVQASGSLMTLYDVVGKEVMKQTLISDHQTVNISNLSSGVYVMQLASRDGSTKTVKVIRE